MGFRTLFGRKPAPGGIPGVSRNDAMTPELSAALLRRSDDQQIIGRKEIAEAAEILTRYKDGKANLERRIVEDELWWELRHWEALRRGGKRDASAPEPEPASAWLFNAILNKHADATDNYPEPVVLPRERSDEDSAKTLSSVLPVIMEYNEFDDTYSAGWWEKLKHGTAAYGVFWNAEKENGLGDIDIRQIDLLKLFWEPGITDIQKSRNLFIVELVDEDLLDMQYPDKKGRLKGNSVDVKQYIYDDTVDVSGKSVVVDWYYKVKSPNGKTLVHYCKFVGNELLYASENDPAYRERGFYDHGLYPVVLDVMFPEKGTPVGFGYVAICKDPQLYIDKLSANILETSMMATKKRFFVSSATNVNEKEFLDWRKPIVHVEGELSDSRIKEIETRPIDGIYYNVMQGKIEELKETAANRDVNSGGTGSGVTAAAAIAALQEAGNKASRDMIASSYRAYTKLVSICIELMRQFYDVSRSFRITGSAPGGYEFVDFSNSGLREQYIGIGSDGAQLFRKPVFDLKIKAQKRNPFSRMEQNERAKELYGLGFFNPQRSQEALNALDMMDFEGIDKVREKVQEGQTLFNIVMQQQQQLAQLSAIVQALTGVRPDGGSANENTSQNAEKTSANGSRSITGTAAKAQRPQQGYTERLAARSKPDMSAVNGNGAVPGSGA